MRFPARGRRTSRRYRSQRERRSAVNFRGSGGRVKVGDGRRFSGERRCRGPRRDDFTTAVSAAM